MKSTGLCAPLFLAHRMEEFEQELIARLTKVQPDGLFHDELETSVVIAPKKLVRDIDKFGEPTCAGESKAQINRSDAIVLDGFSSGLGVAFDDSAENGVWRAQNQTCRARACNFVFPSCGPEKGRERARTEVRNQHDTRKA
jgi:hypothetical protein